MPNRRHYLDQLLMTRLQAFLGEADSATLALLQRQLVWIDLPCGQPLKTQGEPGDAMYQLVSGRLRVSITDRCG